MNGYLGSYLHQIDDKGRLNLPAPFRKGNEERTFVLVSVFPNALTLFPDDVWPEVAERLRGMLRRDPAARQYALKVTANAHEVTLDKQGRILVPARLQADAGITGPTLVVGAIDRIELWNPDLFAAAVEQPIPAADEFLHEVFG